MTIIILVKAEKKKKNNNTNSLLAWGDKSKESILNFPLSPHQGDTKIKNIKVKNYFDRWVTRLSKIRDYPIMNPINNLLRSNM